MPVPRPSVALRAANTLTSAPAKPSTSRTVIVGGLKPSREFSSTQSKKGEHAQESHYDPPTGWLWGVKPGEKVEKEGWENVFFYGFFGSLGLATVAYAFKPDTS